MSPRLDSIAADLAALWHGGLAVARERRKIIIASAALVVFAVVLLLPADPRADRALTTSQGEIELQIARELSWWGDYVPGTLLVAAVLGLAGVARKRRELVMGGVACLLAATLAGLTVNVVKTVAGRARPYLDTDGEFHGLGVEHAYRSFPSGHAATSFATAAAVSCVIPAVSFPATATAVAVCWSRLYLRQHYMSDVLAGAAVGIWFGLAFGVAARRGQRR